MPKLLENYLYLLNELASGDIIQVKSKIQGKEKEISPGKYEVVERWEDGVLIRTSNNDRYFVLNKDIDKIEQIGRYDDFEEFK